MHHATPPERSQTQDRTLGAVLHGGATTFRVWAPDRERVDLVVCAAPAERRASPQDHDRVLETRALQRDARNYWSATFSDLAAGTLYKLRLDAREDQTFPDPASRSQPFGVHGPSCVVDASAYRWADRGWTPPSLDDLVLYELHVGAFSPEGTFAGVTQRLPQIAELGVTAIELMPVADFAGERNWGYDGVALFAPARCYGTPDELRALVDAAHANGLAVFMDVVYNHFGPDGAYATAFSPYYFTDAHKSPWGRGVNLDGPHSGEVRRFFIENALHWIDEYHIDGLRLDATHALVDDSPRHFLAELSTAIRSHGSRPVLLVAEDHRNLNTLLQPVDAGGLGIDGVWADDFHHQARVHAAGDREAYYADFSGTTADLARTLEQGWFFTGQHSEFLGHLRGTSPEPLRPPQFVICIQNHDQVGNRADGARLNHHIDLATYRALSTLLLLAPQTPLLFMGQEWAARSPFLFFTDFDPELGQKVTEGRRQEFSGFAAFADPAVRNSIPDPQAAETFLRSRLDWDELRNPAQAGLRRLYTRLLKLRRTDRTADGSGRGGYTARALDEHTIALDYRQGGLSVIARISGGAGDVDYAFASAPSVCLTTEDADVAEAPQPITVTVAEGRVRVGFSRPGAAVMLR